MLDTNGQIWTYQCYTKFFSGLTRVAFVVGILSRQMIILKLESIWH